MHRPLVLDTDAGCAPAIHEVIAAHAIITPLILGMHQPGDRGPQGVPRIRGRGPHTSRAMGQDQPPFIRASEA